MPPPAASGNGAAAPPPGRARLTLSLYSAAYFGYVGVQMPYFPPWLASRGLTAGDIGMLLAAGFAIRIVANPAIAAVVDRLGERRRAMLVLGLAAVCCYAGLVVVEGRTALMVLSVAAVICTSALLPLGEVLTLRLAERSGLVYGRIRLWGSAAFIVTSMLAGWAVGQAGTGAAMAILLLLVAGILASAGGLPDERVPPADRRPGALLRLARTPAFLVLCAGASLVQASHAALYAFGTLHWQGLGISGTAIGALWSAGVVAEIGLFWLARPALDRFGVTGLLLMAAAAGVVRWLLMPFAGDWPALLPLQVLHGLTFGATHLAAMHFIQRAVAPGAAASAQSLYAAVSGGVAMGLAMLLAGRLYEAAGAQAFFAMAALAGTAVLAALALRRVWNGGRVLV